MNNNNTLTISMISVLCTVGLVLGIASNFPEVNDKAQAFMYRHPSNVIQRSIPIKPDFSEPKSDKIPTQNPKPKQLKDRSERGAGRIQCQRYITRFAGTGVMVCDPNPRTPNKPEYKEHGVIGRYTQDTTRLMPNGLRIGEGQ